MSPYHSIILAGGLAALAQAYTQPTNQTWGSLLTPSLNTPVTQGQTFDVTWDPSSHATDGVTVSLVLCHGDGSNCQNAPSAIVEGVPAAQKSYSWSVPCDLAAGTQSTDTGYGMLVIVDGTGEFQYSTQFSVLASDKCGSSSSTTSSTTTSTSSNSTSSTSLASAGGWTTASNIGPGQGGYSSGALNSSTSAVTVTTSTAGISAPSSIVYATSSAAPGTVTATVAAGTTSYAVATPSAPAASASAFPGIGAKVQASGLFGLIAGAIAMLAL